MVKWDKVNLPRESGGLDLAASRDSRPWNVALLSKLNWRLLNEEDASEPMC